MKRLLPLMLIVLSLWAHATGRPLEERPRQEQ